MMKKKNSDNFQTIFNIPPITSDVDVVDIIFILVPAFLYGEQSNTLIIWSAVHLIIALLYMGLWVLLRDSDFSEVLLIFMFYFQSCLVYIWIES